VGWAGPNKGLGNDNLLGIEAQHALNEPWTSVQYDSYIIGTAALCEALDISVNRVAGHFEHQPGDKTDPSFNMDTFRQRVAIAIASYQPEEDEMQLTDVVNLRTDGAVQYSAKTTTVEGILTSTNYYSVLARNIAASANDAANKALQVAARNEDTLARIEELLSTTTPQEG
jgi:hypothetical protein